MPRSSAVILGLAAAVGLAAPGPAQAQLPPGLPGLPAAMPPALPPPIAAPPQVQASAPPGASLPSLAAPMPGLSPPALLASPTASLAAPAAAIPAFAASTVGSLSVVQGAGARVPGLALAAPGLDVSADLARAANARLGLVDEIGEAVAETAGTYRQRARELLRRHVRAVEADDLGRPVVRGEIAALGVTPAALARVRAAGFRVRSQETVAGLDLAMVVLAPPRGLSAPEAVRRLRALDPAGRYDFNHIYFESGAASPVAAPARAAAAPAAGLGPRIGLVDGSAAAGAPALARTAMVQKAFAPGGARATGHSTAVASLLAGSATGFRGAAPGATLYVADVFGPTPAGGSALSVVRALGWLAEQRTPVINISLVGPPNALLASGVAALVARGHVVVAAVGNDGPSAPPLYPAAYPGVVAVTGVDARRRVLPEAGRGPYVAFAAPGAEMAAAGLYGGLVTVRGTSYAAPLAAGRLARLLAAPGPAAAQRALAALAGEASDLGAPGRDPVYGRGLVAFDLAVRPSALAGR